VNNCFKAVLQTLQKAILQNPPAFSLTTFSSKARNNEFHGFLQQLTRRVKNPAVLQTN